MAQHIGNRLQHARFACTGNALHGDGTIARSQDEPCCAQLALIQLEALIDESGSLDTGVGSPLGKDGFDRALSFIRPGKNARLALDLVSVCQPTLVLALAAQQLP